jgi:transcriptional regulator GlxA family with amidase domain
VNIGIYIYDGAEVLDFSGPFEVFSTAARICESGSPFKVFLIGETGDVVTARGGFNVAPAYGFHNHPPIDVLIIPGGVHRKEMTKPHVIDWIFKAGQQANLVASVCTGAFLLAEAGILTTQSVTTHWEDVPELRKNFADLTVHASKRWVDAGNIVTSGGISAGIDMCLYLVARLHGPDLAEKTARKLEFNWIRNP